MSDFGDDLGALLVKKKEQFFVREMQEERQRQAATKLRDDTRRAAGRLAREVFLPLLQEFREVLEAAGVLCGGVVEEKEEVASGKWEARSHSPFPTPHCVCCRLRSAGSAPGSPHVEIRVACTAGDDGGIEAGVECVDVTATEFGRS